MSNKIRVTVWNEFRHEKKDKAVSDVYPKGIHGQIAAFLGENVDFVLRTATLDEPENGLPQSVLDETDVLIWWGHMAHGDVLDETVDRVQERILAGMGLILLHSAHFSKIFKRLMGQTCNLKWREVGEKERIWAVRPGHPIVKGVPEQFVVPRAEMYGEPFDIPQPDELIFVSWFQGGEVFRSGCCYHRGKGKIFYFRPGHETYPIFYQPEIQTVIKNAVYWAAPVDGPSITFNNVKPLEELNLDE